MLNSEIIAQIRAANKYIQDDNMVTDRFIYNLAKAKASLLLKRELNQRRLLTSDSVYQPLECLDLITVPGTECGLNNEIARSKAQLPQIEEGLYNYFIQGVFNIDNSEEIYYSSIRDFINFQKLRIKPNKTFYNIKNRYLYILNPDVKKVNVYAYFTEQIVTDACYPMYDREFKFPPYLLDNLYEMCNQSLLNYHKFGTDTEDNNKADA